MIETEILQSDDTPATGRSVGQRRGRRPRTAFGQGGKAAPEVLAAAQMKIS
jgi:hypothetical protein